MILALEYLGSSNYVNVCPPMNVEKVLQYPQQLQLLFHQSHIFSKQVFSGGKSTFTKIILNQYFTVAIL